MMHSDTRLIINIFTEALILKLVTFSILFFLIYFTLSYIKKRKLKYHILILSGIFTSLVNVFILGVITFVYDYVYPTPEIVKQIHPAVFTLSALFLIPYFIISLQLKSKKYLIKKS